ncbi:MAG: translation elongation factor Ts [Verrucomicrobiota bacterium]
MAEITASLVKELRDKTNCGMMDCKAALKESGGNLEEAETILRKKGIASADKKAARAAKEGVIASRISEDGKTGILVEVNCETDFVAKNENFTSFVDEILDHISSNGSAGSVEELLQEDHGGTTLEEFVKAKVGELGENLVVQRFSRFALDGDGSVGSYIHLAGKVGVLIEVKSASADAAGNDDFKTLVKDLCLHIAAAHPSAITREEVPSDQVEAEKDIYREQMKDKPENVIEKIITGKIDKFYSQIALLEQGFVKDPDQTIKQLIESKGKDLGGDLTISRFERYAVGEEA